jgi:hypothetical protein
MAQKPVNALAEFEARLDPKFSRLFQGLKTPFLIQQYLDDMPYIGEERDRSPLNVLRDGQCHCLDGGFLAALALWRIGHKPLLIDLRPAPNADDDHVLALYRVDGRWGAVAKSNYVNLGFREAVHQSLRELAMTYFEHFVNVDKQKTLRAYTRPFDASRFKPDTWGWDEAEANALYRKFYMLAPIPLIAGAAARKLSRVAARNYAAETMHTDLDEAFGNRDY